MKYSFIISYRNREYHLKTIVPRIREIMAGKDFEIIVSEQADQHIFRQYNLDNVGAQIANGDIFVFHDVDYYPVDVEYWNDNWRTTPGEDSGVLPQVFLPAAKVIFVDKNMQPKPIEQVPGGYQHFRDGVDSRMGIKQGEESFFGGCLVFPRITFERVNGFCPVYKGWGPGDVDMRVRLHHYQVGYIRSKTGLFYALDHPDSGPAANDPVFIQNQSLLGRIGLNLEEGLRSKYQPPRKLVTPKLDGVDIWVESTNHDAPPPKSHIVSSFNMTEGEE